MPTHRPLGARPAGDPAPKPIPTARVVVAESAHRADWLRRAQVVRQHARRVAYARESGHWAGAPLKLRPCGSGYVLVSGFARLAIAVDAGLPTVQALLEPALPKAPLAQIRLSARYEGYEPGRLREEKLRERREIAARLGALPVGLTVRAVGEDEYELLDGLYWYEVAKELGLERVGVLEEEERMKTLLFPPQHKEEER
ncbi:MAG: hypothetical protein JXA37_10670 [Chloroflexia bacterium]|nr:hypothetical protein [Chloroflexia bacterium]